MRTPDLPRLTTGSADFDALLDGGIPVSSVIVITGEPGAGKTVVAVQMLFRLAALGKRCVYFSTLSEPAPLGGRCSVPSRCSRRAG
jgi:circadian clock protein KaiC